MHNLLEANGFDLLIWQPELLNYSVPIDLCFYDDSVFASPFPPSSKGASILCYTRLFCFMSVSWDSSVSRRPRSSRTQKTVNFTLYLEDQYADGHFMEWVLSQVDHLDLVLKCDCFPWSIWANFQSDFLNQIRSFHCAKLWSFLGVEIPIQLLCSPEVLILKSIKLRFLTWNRNGCFWGCWKRFQTRAICSCWPRGLERCFVTLKFSAKCDSKVISKALAAFASS